MHTKSGDGESPRDPELRPSFIALPPNDDDGMAMVSGFLIAATASIVLWGICAVVIMMLRS